MLRRLSKNNGVDNINSGAQSNVPTKAQKNSKILELDKIFKCKKSIKSSSNKTNPLKKSKLPLSSALTSTSHKLSIESVSNIQTEKKKDPQQKLHARIQEQNVLNDAQIFEKLKDIKSTMQIFCLFCDKKFSTKALLAKHTERVHTIVSQRRSSGRNSQSFINSTCTYCTKPKKSSTSASSSSSTTCANVELQSSIQVQGSSNDLNNLFLHFNDKHPDKYFSCKQCIIRFQDLNLLQDHSKQHHPAKPEEFKFVEPISEDILNQNVQTRRQRRLSIEYKPIIEEATISPRRSTSKTRKLRNDSPSGTPVKLRSKVGRFCPSLNDADISNSMVAETNHTRSRSEVLSCTFDINFYDTIASNVRKNLSSFVDGKLEEGQSLVINPTPTIRSTLVRSPVHINSDGEIHKATSLSIVTAFPTLLTADQYNGCDSLSSKKRSHTKNSWKWKWDSVKKYKYVNEGGKIVKKVKHGCQGLRDLSKLDMWTQLTMRTKFEKHLNLEEKTEERRQIDELNFILNHRRLPDISLEQSEQSFIKLERSDFNEIDGVEEIQRPSENEGTDELDFPMELNLSRRTTQTSRKSVILSGEWARPRFYVCFGCGEKFEKIKGLEEHKYHKHPYVASTHYEMVGRELLQDDLYKNFFVPLKALQMLRENGLNTNKLKTDCTQRNDHHDESMDSVHSVIPIEGGTASDDSDSKTTALTVHSNITRSTDELDNINYLVEQQEHRTTSGNSLPENGLECSKCNKICHGSLELYKHILDCSGDYAWILAKRKKYRYIGTSRRRKFNRNSNSTKKKKDATDSATKSERQNNEDNRSVTQSPKPCKSMNSAQKNKQTDAETIQRMLENLPAKRVCRQILPQLNQKPKNKKVEEKSCSSSKAIVNEPEIPSAVSEEKEDECILNGTNAILTPEVKKSVKNTQPAEKAIEEIVVNNGNIAIITENKKSSKSTVKSVKKVNQKSVAKDAVDEQIVDETSLIDIKEDESKKKLRSSPRNQSNVEVSEEKQTSSITTTATTTTPTATTTSTRRPKKINDCIAKLQEKLGLPFFGSPTSSNKANDPSLTLNEIKTPEKIDISKHVTAVTEVNTSPVKEILNKSSEIDDTKLVKTPKRKSLTRKIVKTDISIPSLPSKKIEQPQQQMTAITPIKPIQIQTVHPTIQHQPVTQQHQHFSQKPIAHVEAIRPKHFIDTNLPPRRPSILLPTLVPPPPPPPILLPSTVTLPLPQDLLLDAPLDLSRKPVVENGALDLSKSSKNKPSEIKTHTIADILQNSQAKRRSKSSKKEVVPVPPIPISSPITQSLPIVNELKNKLPNVSITSKCVLNIPQTPAFDKGVETLKKQIKENTQLVIPNFKGCVDIIKIPAPKPPIIHAEKPSVTIKAIPPPPPKIIDKPQDKGFISAFESFIEKKAADNSIPPPPLGKDSEASIKEKKPRARKAPKKAKEELKKPPPEKDVKGNDENKSPTNKRRSNRIKVDPKNIEAEKAKEKLLEKDTVEEKEKPMEVPQDSPKKDPIEMEKPLEISEVVPVEPQIEKEIPNEIPEENHEEIQKENDNCVEKEKSKETPENKRKCKANLEEKEKRLEFSKAKGPKHKEVKVNVDEKEQSKGKTKDAKGNVEDKEQAIEISKPKGKSKESKANTEAIEQQFEISKAKGKSKDVVDEIEKTKENPKAKGKSKDIPKDIEKSKPKGKLRGSNGDEKETSIEKEISKETPLEKEKSDVKEKPKGKPKKPIKEKLKQKKVLEVKKIIEEEEEKPKKTSIEKENHIEKEILSDEDVPLSVTKASLVAESSKNGAKLQTENQSKTTQPIEIEVSKPKDPESSKKKKKILEQTEQESEIVGSVQEEIPELKKRSRKKAAKEPPLKKETKSKRGASKKTEPDAVIDVPIVDKESLNTHLEKEPKEGTTAPLTVAPIVPIEETSKVSEENNVLKENIPETTILDKSVEEVSVLNENTTETEKLTENTEIISGEAQVKKKRKRRKNELAAIVADQLLESFKEVDKSRIDDLKMLENLAYEKSEDLLLTGMRLTPTTKRKQQSESLPATPTPQKKAVPRKKSQKEKPLETVKQTTKTVEDSDKTFGNGKTFESFRSLGESAKDLNEDHPAPAVFTSALPNHRVDVKKKRKNHSSLNLDDEDDDKIVSQNEKKQKKKKKNVGDTKREMLKITELISKLSSLSICIGKHKSKKDSMSASKVSSIFKSIKERDNKNILLKPSVFNAKISEPPPVTEKVAPIEEEKVVSRDPRLNKKQVRSSQRLSRRNSQCAPNTLAEAVSSIQPVTTAALNNDEEQEDCFLAEITKKVNDKIMAEDKDFNDTNDGFELVKTMLDGDNGDTRMSACSAPPAPGDENTNTDIMDMDLDDNMSVYSTFSTKSVGSRRRRRKSILLSRKPKKNRNLEDLDDRKFECFLCNKAYSTLSSLKSHNKTLTHVQNLSQQEFLNSQQQSVKSKSLSPIPQRSLEKSHSKPKVTVVVREVPAEPFNPTNTEALHTSEQNFESESTRLKLNPDEKLFYECCNILKGSETPRVERTYPITNTTYTYDIPRPPEVRKNLPADGNQFSDISSDTPNVDNRNVVSARIVVNQPYGGQPSNFRSPIHSASSQGSVAAAPVFQSTNCRLKTKAAMKGYDNLKVSIPTYGLDLQQALERSPQGGCKLTALADIALGSEASKAAIPIDNDSDAIDTPLVEEKAKTPEYLSVSGTQKQKDVYDFDDTIDNMSDKVAHIQPKPTKSTKIVIPDRPFKNIGRDEETTIKFQKPEVVVQQNEESLLSTLSYSDRDDFNYGSVSDKYDEDEEKNKVSPEAKASSSDSSSMSSAVTAKTLENKSLIMGRIFKKAVRDEPPTKKKGSETGKKKDFNKLFDNLRNIDFKQTKKMIKKVTKKKAAAVKSTKKTAIPVQKPLEDGQRKSQRRCAANRSKKLVEMWSSDEYEEFLSTNDVIALIEEKEREEKKKQAPAAKITARRNTVVIEKAPEPKPKAKPGKSTLITPLVPQTAPKITNRRKTISVVNQPKLSSDPFRKPQTFPTKQQPQDQKQVSQEEPVKSMENASKISRRRKTISQKNEEIVNNVTTPKKKKSEESESRSLQRKKRQSVDRLYYWSSSSEDEDFGRLPSPNQEEEEVASEQYQQHGWIVGGSHKKLVKLLAFAKGTKKVDDSGLKPSSNGKRK